MALDAAAITREYWSACGLRVSTRIDGGLIIEWPDYYVVRVAGPTAVLARVAAAAATSSSAEVRAQAAVIAATAKRRGEAKNLGADDRYVNVAGGARDGIEVSSAWAWIEEMGLASAAAIVPGPLIRRTHGFLITHEPLAVASSYTHVADAIAEAHAELRAEGVVDLEFDLQGQVEPKWGHHSMRRHADSNAQQALREGKLPNVTKQIVDYFFGWCLKEMATDMQLHYAGLDHLARRLLAQVTMWL